MPRLRLISTRTPMSTLERNAGGKPGPTAPPGSLLAAAVPTALPGLEAAPTLTGSSAVHRPPRNSTHLLGVGSRSPGGQACHPVVPAPRHDVGCPRPLSVAPLNQRPWPLWTPLSDTRPATGPAQSARPGLCSFPPPKPSAAIPLPQGSPHGTASQVATDVSQTPQR